MVIRSSVATRLPREIYFFSSAFPNVNCPCPGAAKLNGEVTPPPVDVEGVTGVNTNGAGLEPVASFVVVVVVPEKSKGTAGLSVTGVGLDGVVVIENALTGVDVVPNALPFLRGLGPGLEVSCLGVEDGKIPGEVPVIAEVDGKESFRSDPPAGLFAPKLNRD